MRFEPNLDNPLFGRPQAASSVAPATPVCLPSQSLSFNALSTTNSSSVLLRHRATQTTTDLPLTQDSEKQPAEIQLMTLVNLAARFMHVLEGRCSRLDFEQARISPVETPSTCPPPNVPGTTCPAPNTRPPTVSTPAKRQPSVSCPRPELQLPKKKRRITSPIELKLAMIGWKNKLDRAKYLLEQGLAQDIYRDSLLDDLREIHAHRDAIADLSPTDSEVHALVGALRPHRHKSEYGPEVRGIAIDILDLWSQRWFQKPIRRKGQTET